MDKTVLDTMKDRVKAILEVSISSRNSDASLVANYWYLWDMTHLCNVKVTTGDAEITPDSVALPLKAYEFVTQPSQIERVRRIVQEEAVLSGDITEMGKYLPTEAKILSIRRINCVKWKDVINNNKIEFILNYGKEQKSN